MYQIVDRFIAVIWLGLAVVFASCSKEIIPGEVSEADSLKKFEWVRGD